MYWLKYKPGKHTVLVAAKTGMKKGKGEEVVADMWNLFTGEERGRKGVPSSRLADV